MTNSVYERMSSQAVPQMYTPAFLGIIMLPIYGCTQHKSLLTSLKSENTDTPASLPAMEQGWLFQLVDVQDMLLTTLVQSINSSGPTHQCSFQFSCPNSASLYLDDIINTSSNLQVAISITVDSISCEIVPCIVWSK